MRRVLVIVFAFVALLPWRLFATDLVGLSWNQNIDSPQWDLVTVNPSTGRTTSLNSFPDVPIGGGFTVALDGSRAFVRGNQGGLYQFEWPSGRLLRTTSLPESTSEYILTLTALSADTLLGVTHNFTTDTKQLITVDAQTGQTQVLNRLSFTRDLFYTSRWFTVEPNGTRAFALSNSNTLYVFSMPGGELLSSSPLHIPTNLDLRTIRALSADTLMGVAYNRDTQRNELRSIAASTGQSTLLQSFTFDTGVNDESFTLDPVAHRAFLVSGDQVDTLNEFDLTNGNLVSTRRSDRYLAFLGVVPEEEEGPSLARIVAGSITYTTIEDNTGLGITFDPKSNFGLTLANVATLGGFSHFNWMQIVNKWPGASALISDGFCVPRIPLALPYLDPPPRGIGNMILCSPADELQFYYDEVTEVDGKPLDPDFYISKQIDQNSFVSRLNFYDIPSNAFVIPGINYMEFWTYLVGVTSDNKARILWGPLKWKSDHNIWGFGGALRNHEPLPPGGEGGIFEVEEMASLYDAPLDVMEVLRDAGSEWPVTDETEAVIVKGSINDDPERDCVSFGSASIVLDGTWSMDPEGDPLTYTWTGPFGSVEGVRVTVTVPVGTHEITLTVDDGNGGVDSDTVEITVEACPLNCDIDESGKFDGRDVAKFVKGCGRAKAEALWCERNAKSQGKKWYDKRCPAEGVVWLCDVNGDGSFNGRDVAAYKKQCKVR